MQFKSKKMNQVFDKYVMPTLTTILEMEKQSGKYSDSDLRFKMALEKAIYWMKDLTYTELIRTPKYMQVGGDYDDNFIDDARVRTIFNKCILWPISDLYGSNAKTLYHLDDSEDSMGMRYRNAYCCALMYLSEMEYSI